MTVTALLLSAVLGLAPTQASFADDGDQVLTIDHVVQHVSTMPANAGQPIQLYVRERVQDAAALRSPASAGKVVLFVHGATLPGEVAMDLTDLGLSTVLH